VEKSERNREPHLTDPGLYVFFNFFDNVYFCLCSVYGCNRIFSFGIEKLLFVNQFIDVCVYFLLLCICYVLGVMEWCSRRFRCNGTA
jgi:hypothetical protein